MTFSARACFLLGFVGVCAVVGAKESVESKRDGLKKIQSEIEEKRQEKKNTSRRVRELRKEVDRISTELESARKAYSLVESRLIKAEKTRAEAESRVRSSRHDLGEWRDRLSSETRDYFIRWSLGSEGSFSSLMYEKALLSDRAASLSFAEENHQSVQSLRDDLAEAEENLRRLRLDKQREERRAENARGRMRDLQKTAEGRQMVLDRQLKELHVSARKFEKKIADLLLKEKEAKALAAKKAKATVVPTVKGVGNKWRRRLPWPVAGPVVEKFGRTLNAEVGAPTISNGVLLRPMAGATVRAVQEGEVLFAGPFMNYGLMALVSHSDHVHTIYAQLGGLQLTRGQRVMAGDVVGDPGRDENGRPQVYFELRVDGEPVNPEEWLRN
ncbi:MAG: peptidoglycan DD-metalloendopeptidase family protein [Elusimicrobia bacterium]|jgi:septal ring factor EnvC (AmiA/AmiB activator)|nr:peptidoglycan DD-metalloendopeptidase family protein [Elusimicrobiota bacterium]